jgi:two-component system response regulator PilR (NtrC family)
MKYKGKILVVEDERGMREMLGILLSRAGYEVQCIEKGEMALNLLRQGLGYDLVITDLVMPEVDGIEILKETKKQNPETQVIVITAYGTTESAVQAMKQGAYDYIVKPFKVEEILVVVEKAIEKKEIIKENINLKEQIKGQYRFGDVIGKSKAMQDILALCRKISSTATNILISGESGTGKELIARTIHFSGSRKRGPFVPINCGAIPETLLESELFGHLKGAFTGALTSKEGLFKAAQGGTLFLDEIGELPPMLQVKILRAIQEKKIKPIGGVKEEPVDVRIIAATNKNIKEEVEKGKFRADLYWRLNVIHIHIPPLRERREDIPLMIEHFLKILSLEMGKDIKGLSQRAMQFLMNYSYPGNVRELHNILEYAITLAKGNEIDIDTFPPSLTSELEKPSLLNLDLFKQKKTSLDEVISELERNLLLQALAQTKGIRKKAAQLLGISFRSMRYRLYKYKINSQNKDQD